MTQVEFLNKVAEQRDFNGMEPITKSEMAKDVAVVFQVIQQCLENNISVSLPGIGKLQVKGYPAYNGHNPKTGEAIHIAERRRVVYKPSSVMKRRLNCEIVPEKPVADCQPSLVDARA